MVKFSNLRAQNLRAYEAWIDILHADSVAFPDHTFASEDYVDEQVAQAKVGVNYLFAVLGFYATGSYPETPSADDHIVDSTTDLIQTWSGTEWIETEPVQNDVVYNVDDTQAYLYNGDEWIVYGMVLDHAQLINAGTLTHAQIDERLGQAVNTTSVPEFAGVKPDADGYIGLAPSGTAMGMYYGGQYDAVEGATWTLAKKPCYYTMDENGVTWYASDGVVAPLQLMRIRCSTESGIVDMGPTLSFTVNRSNGVNTFGGAPVVFGYAGDAASKTSAPYVFTGGLGITGASVLAGITADSLSSGTINATSSATVPAPTTNMHAATKKYVDDTVAVPASATVAGIVTTGTQTLAGAKTLSGVLTLSNTTDASSTSAAAVILSGGLASAKTLWSANSKAALSSVGRYQTVSGDEITTLQHGKILGGGTKMTDSVFEAPLRLSANARVFPAAEWTTSVGTITGTGSFVDGGYKFTTGETAAGITWPITSAIDPQHIGSIRWKWTSDYTGVAPIRNYWVNLNLGTGASAREVSVFHNSGSTAVVLVYTDTGGGSPTQTSIVNTGFSAVTGQTYEMLLTWSLNAGTGNIRFFINGVIFRHATVEGLPGTATRTLLTIGNQHTQTRPTYGTYRDLYITKTELYTANYTPGYSMLSSVEFEDQVSVDSLKIREAAGPASATLTVGSTGVVTSSAIISGVAPTSDLHLSTKKYVDDTVAVPASATVAGIVTTGAQTFAGVKASDAFVVGSTLRTGAMLPSVADGIVIASGPRSNTNAVFEASLRRSPVAKLYSGEKQHCVGTIGGAGTFTNGKYATAASIASSLTWPIDSTIDPGLVGCVRWRWTSGFTGTRAGICPFITMCTGTTSANGLTCYLASNSTTLTVSAYGSNTTAFVSSSDIATASAFVSGVEYEMELNFDLNLSGKVRLFIDGVLFIERTITTAQTITDRNVFAVGQIPWSVQTPAGSFRDVVVYEAVQHTANYTPNYTCNGSTTIDGRVVTDSVLLQSPLDWTKSATLAVDSAGVLATGAIVSGLAPTADLHLSTKKYVDDLAVALTGNQTVAGVKTFSSSPIVPTPTTDYQASTKLYVDTRTTTTSYTTQADVPLVYTSSTCLVTISYSKVGPVVTAAFTTLNTGGIAAGAVNYLTATDTIPAAYRPVAGYGVGIDTGVQKYWSDGTNTYRFSLDNTGRITITRDPAWALNDGIDFHESVSYIA